MKKTSAQIAEAIFGGPSPSTATVEAFARANDLRFPAKVVALPEGKRLKGVAAKSGRAVPLRLHEGMVYWWIPAGAAPAVRSAYECASPSRLVYAVQQAILLLRRKELRLLGRKSASGRKAFTLQEEVQAFGQALREVRNASGTAEEALEIWSGIVLQRYQQQVNAIRLRFLEFLTALTRGMEGRFAYISASLVRRIYQTQHLQELARLPHAIAHEISPLVIGGVSGEAAPSPPVRRALAHIGSVFREPVSLSDVARACHVSPSHLARLFRKETGESVVAHLQRLRINHARELLATTDRGLLEIAMESGFESIEHFHRLFRRITGVTPRTYRLAAK